MMPEMPPKCRLKMEMGLDKFSNLPSDVIEKILLLLPIRDAVRTSVLSNKWRYRWAKLPQLVFDGQCVSSQNHTSFVTIVDHALLVHIGPLHSFKLSQQGFLASRDIDRWIVHLSRHSIKEFKLELHEGQCYNIPSCLFSWQDMIHLKLKNCFLKPLPTFKGFRSLKRLDIVRVTLAQDVLEYLIVCCPLLKTLTFIDCDGFTRLKIDAPKLQFLGFRGRFDDVILENTINLDAVTIYLEANVDQRWVPRSSSNLVLFFLHLPRVRRLAIRSNFLKYLAVSALTRKVPKPCLHLKFLTIEIHFNDLEEILTAVRLLRSSPALQELEITAFPKDRAVVGEVNSWLDDNLIWSFTKLRLVKITSISGAKAELDFIRFLLLSSPVLQRMTIKPASVNGSSELLKKLLRLGRASVHSEIIYLDS
ncbi:F-box/FBD/LRR-repeat protein At1g13570-like isoform X1 [Rosa rugosa]|uniref:F-box/FBD/LRR-repeat protein At1g13570-like isoform X1 n=2 Tax=Rosa rugosa TaxID=74645 RepID=UPI002B415AE9|nr:F-box/FBD/LRR-repeat protein At1g13570-like isoform X1 [Rosa rugosa]